MVRAVFTNFGRARTQVTGTRFTTRFILRFIPHLQKIPTQHPNGQRLQAIHDQLIIAFRQRNRRNIGVLQLAQLVGTSVNTRNNAATMAIQFANRFLPAGARYHVQHDVFSAYRFQSFHRGDIGRVIRLHPIRFATRRNTIRQIWPTPTFRRSDFTIMVDEVMGLRRALNTTFIISRHAITFDGTNDEGCRVNIFRGHYTLVVGRRRRQYFDRHDVRTSDEDIAVRVIFRRRRHINTSNFRFNWHFFGQATARGTRPRTISKANGRNSASIDTTAFRNFHSIDHHLGRLWTANIHPKSGRQFLHAYRYLRSSISFTLRLEFSAIGH